MLKDKVVDLKEYYNNFHKGDFEIDSFENVILKPFVPYWEYNKFLDYFNPLIKNRKIVISRVTGSGKTTIVDRISKFSSGSSDRILQLQCVEEMPVEYHKEWIGYNNTSGFEKGKLLKFFEQCKSDKKHKYVFILDDFDKIYPSTFFGSKLWVEMDNPENSNTIEGYGEVEIPDNFILISVTHVGISNLIALNNEYYRRLGEQLPVNPDANEFLMGIQECIEDKGLKIPLHHVKKLIYFFKTANEIIAKK